MSRTWSILGLVAVVLVGLVLLLANPFQDQVRRDNPEQEALFDPASVENVTGIRITTLGRPPVELARVDGRWVVASEGGFPADTAAVSNILRAVRQAESSGIASRNPANRGKFQVDSTGVEVVLEGGGGEPLRLVVGRMGDDFTTSYVRRGDEDEVRVVRGINRPMLDRTVGFRDRTLLRFPPSEVASVAAVMPEGNWDLVRADTTWILVEGGGEDSVAVESSRVETLLGTLGTLSADGFLEEGARDTVVTGLDEPDHEFTVRLLNGSETSLRVGGMNERNQYYVSRPDRNAVYLLSQWRIDNLAARPGELKGETEEP
jgi:hypothetical protein